MSQISGLDNSVSWLTLKLKNSICIIFLHSTVAQVVSQYRNDCILWHKKNYREIKFSFNNILPLTDHPEQPAMNPTRQKNKLIYHLGILWLQHRLVKWGHLESNMTYTSGMSNQRHLSESRITWVSEWGSEFIQTDLFYRCAMIYESSSKLTSLSPSRTQLLS